MKKFSVIIIGLLVAGLWLMPVQRANAQTEFQTIEREIRRLEADAESCIFQATYQVQPGPTASEKEWALYENILTLTEQCLATIEIKLDWLRRRLGELQSKLPSTTAPRERTKWRTKIDEWEKRVAAAEEKKKRIKERLKKSRKAIKPKQPAPGFTAENKSSRSSDDTIYKVVINHEEQYSIWPADRENALGWDAVGKTGTKEECLAYIKEVVANPVTPGPGKISIPSQAQNGRNLELTGSFDSNAKTTEVTIEGQRVEVLEETASKSVVKIPSNLTGQVKVTVDEGSNKAEGTCRIIKVDVTATRTNLLKGESAIVTVTVTGLDGIKRTIPLHLTAKGVINMDGGNTQLLRIHPPDVQGGRYTITRKITGRQAGGFDVTATVITKPWYITLGKDARDNGWRVKKDGKRIFFIIENVKDPVTGGLLEGEYVLETGCGPGTIKSLMEVLLKRGKGQVSGVSQPFVNFPFFWWCCWFFCGVSRE